MGETNPLDQTDRAVTGGLQDMVGNDVESGWADKRTRCCHMATPDGGNLETNHGHPLCVPFWMDVHTLFHIMLGTRPAARNIFAVNIRFHGAIFP